MNRADVVIVLAAVAFLVVGWRRGLVRSLLAFVGLLLGMAIGIAVVPPLLVRWDMSVWISMAAILVVGGSALLVHWLLLQLDARAREVIRWRVDGVLDRLGGAFFGVGAALMSSWMLGLAFTASALPGLSEPAKGSLVLRQMDRMDLPMSHLIVKWFSRLGEDVDFSRYLDPLTSERIVDVPAPPPGIVETPEIVASGGGVARITSLTGPASGQEGTGFWIAPGRLMTAAHVVNGASRITVEHSFARHDAQVVVCDPELDAAVLDVSGGGGLPLRWANA